MRHTGKKRCAGWCSLAAAAFRGPCLHQRAWSHVAACKAVPAGGRSCGAVGVFPFRTVMTQGKMKMGYVEVVTQPGCRLFPAGATVRGHVFHFSEMASRRPPLCRPAATASEAEKRRCTRAVTALTAAHGAGTGPGAHCQRAVGASGQQRRGRLGARLPGNHADAGCAAAPARRSLSGRIRGEI